MHTPVLLKEVINFLDLQSGDFIIDGTVDGGGHAEAILEKIGSDGKLVGIDLDARMAEECGARLSEYQNAEIVHGNYADIPEILRKENLGKADGLLLDLGFSSEQLESSGRGFSFLKDEPLVMTYDESRKPAKEILYEIGVKDLAKMIFELSGEKFAMKIAKAIKERESEKLIETSGEFAEVIKSAVSKNYERGRINPATRTFQALRIYVNDELGNLRKILSSLHEILKPEGRVVVISFHSLEDKIVKESFREMEKVGKVEILTKKPVSASAEEVAVNPRSRSAKLRACSVT